MIRKTLLTAAALLLSAIPAMAEPFTFIALGDMPYGPASVSFPLYESLIKEVNSRNPAFTIHIGDTKSGAVSCSNENLDRQLQFLNSFSPALIYTPGDNEWADCHAFLAGRYDPLERLDYIRSTYFKDPTTSFGTNPIALESQAQVMAKQFPKYVENTRFTRDGIVFVQAHVIGSNNNFEPRNLETVSEFFERDRANIAWLNDSFNLAMRTDAPAIVISIQADMFAKDFDLPSNQEGFERQSGYANFGNTLRVRAKKFGKPVLLIYGDSHTFHVFRPFRRSAPNVMALQVFGERDMHAVAVRADPADRAVFGYTPVLNPALE